MAARAYEPFADAQYRDGIPVIISSLRRNSPQALDPAMKSCNLINNILAVREAQAKKAAEPLMLNDARRRGGGRERERVHRLRGRAGDPAAPRRHPARGDPGAGPRARGASSAIEVARAVDPRARPCSAADEAFITSTLKEVMPIATVDGTPIGSGKPGPVTLRLLDAYREYARAR